MKRARKKMQVFNLLELLLFKSNILAGPQAKI